MPVSPRPLLALLVTTLLVALPGCASVETYFTNLGRDASDVIDFKYGATANSFGLGAKVEASNFIGAGGGGGIYEVVYEDFGRHLDVAPMEFVHLGFFGLDGPGTENPQHVRTAVYALGINANQMVRPDWVNRFRFGGEVLLFNAMGGLYLNLGQLGDALAALVTWDPAGDDGLPLDTLILGE